MVEVAWQTTIPVFVSGILVLSRKQKEETRMYGAILGDMIGSPYEFDQGKKTKDFPMFIEESRITDDTVMTIAVSDALLGVSAEAPDGVICDLPCACLPLAGSTIRSKRPAESQG